MFHAYDAAASLLASNHAEKESAFPASASFFASSSPTSSSLASFSSSPSSLEVKETRATGLLSKEEKTEINTGITTIHTKKIYGTIIGDLYAHYAESETRVLHPNTVSPSISMTSTPLLPSITMSPASVILSTEVNKGTGGKDDTTTIHTTEIYQTSLNGFAAQFTKTSSNIITPTILPLNVSGTTSSAFSSIHFPTPVRGRKPLNPSESIFVTTVTVTATTVVPSMLTTNIVNNMSNVRDTESSVANPSNGKITDVDENDYEEVEDEDQEDDEAEISFGNQNRPSLTRRQQENRHHSHDRLQNHHPRRQLKGHKKKPANSNNSGTNDDSFLPFEEDEEENEEEDNDRHSLYSHNRKSRGHQQSNQNNGRSSGFSGGSSQTIFRSQGQQQSNDYHNFFPSSWTSRHEKSNDRSSFNAPVASQQHFSGNDETLLPQYSKPNHKTSSSISVSSSSSSFISDQDTPSKKFPAGVFGQRVSASGSVSHKTLQQDDYNDYLSHHQLHQEGISSPRHENVPKKNLKMTENERSLPEAASTTSINDRTRSSLNRHPDSFQSSFPRSNAELRQSRSQSRYIPEGSSSSSSRRSRFEEVTGVTRGSHAVSESGVANTGSFQKDSDEHYNDDSSPRPNSRRSNHSRKHNRPSLRTRDERKNEDLVSSQWDTSQRSAEDTVSFPRRRRKKSKRRNRKQSTLTTTVILQASSASENDYSKLFVHHTVHPSFAQDSPLHVIEHQTPSSSLSLPPKSTLTVTSIASWTKTFPIKHGFKTSYATVTTSGFNTSIIRPDQYEVRVHPTNTLSFLTYLSSDSQSLHDERNFRDYQVLVTTTSLSEIKLIPIRVGFSTRTDTITSTHVLTQLKTVYATGVSSLTPQSTVFDPAKNAALGVTSYSILTTSYVTRETITSTTISSLVVDGRILLSTVTDIHLRDPLTVTTTKTIPILATNAFDEEAEGREMTKKVSLIRPTSQSSSSFLFITTLITLELTGESGSVTKVVTPLTLPLNSIVGSLQATRVKRNALEDNEMLATGQPSLLSSSSSSLSSSSYTFNHHPDPITFDSKPTLSSSPELYASFSLPASAETAYSSSSMIF